MSFDVLQESWKKSFEESLSSIENSITPKNDDYEDLTNWRLLCKWLLDTSLNSYEFMPHGYQSYKSDPYSTDSLFHLIHHALIDDGEVSFVKLIHKGKIRRVFMMFVWHNEDCFNPLCVKENQSFINSTIEHAKNRNGFCETMRTKQPDNTKYQEQPIPTIQDFEFVAHRHPLQFIEEVEQLEKERIDNNARFEELRKKILA